MVESTNQILRQIRDRGAVRPSLGESTNELLRQIRDAGLGGGGGSDETDSQQNMRITELEREFDNLGSISYLDVPPPDSKTYGFKNGVLAPIITAFELSPNPSVLGVNRFEGATYDAAYASLVARFLLPENASDLQTYISNELKICILSYLKDSGDPSMTLVAYNNLVWVPIVDTSLAAFDAEESGLNALKDRVTAIENKLDAVKNYTLLLRGI